MRILIDHQAFSIQRYGGVSRIFAELISYFDRNNVISYTPHLYLDNEYYNRLKYNSHVSIYSHTNHFFTKVIKTVLPIINNLYTKVYIRFFNFDIYMPSYYDTYLISKMGNTPIIVYVYDMIHEKYPNLFKDTSISQNKLSLMEKSTIIIAISENTKRDILEIYPQISSSKIHVVHLSDSIKIKFNEALYVNLPEKYILYVGTRKDYKNFNTLLQAFILFQLNHPDVSLLCVGGGKFSSQEMQEFRTAGIENMVRQISLIDEDLYTVYHSAIVFVFPSLYEGFGIPVLEAMRSGCPVILGSLSSFPEIAGDAGIYCDVSNPLEINQALIKVFQNRDFRTNYIAKGKTQAEKFTWNETAKKTLEICQSIVD